MGSVGPYGASLCDGSEYNGNYLDSIESKKLFDWHKPRIQALIEAGVDILLFETIPSLGEATVLLDILTEFPEQKACLSFSCKVIYLSHLFIIMIMIRLMNYLVLITVDFNLLFMIKKMYPCVLLKNTLHRFSLCLNYGFLLGQ